MIATLAFLDTQRLVHLSPVDLVIIVFYFVACAGHRLLSEGPSQTGEDFFLAGREMTAWVAGLSFLAANLGSLELMGWAGAAYQYGILAAHWYWIGAIPAMVFLALVMMPFYYISQDPLRPGLSETALRRASRALSAVSFGFMTVLMSGINMYSHGAGAEGGAGLGYQLQHLGFFRHRRRLCGPRRAALRHLQRGSAVRPHLAGRAADLHPRPDRSRRMERHGGAHRHKCLRQNTRICGAPWAPSTTIPWASTGPASSSGLAQSSPWAIGPPTFWSSSAFSPPKIFAAAEMAPIIGAGFKMMVPFIVILPGLLGLAPAADETGSGIAGGGHRRP